MDPTALPYEELLQWRNCLERFGRVELPNGHNLPNKYPLQFLLFTCDDGLERTKSWAKRTPDEMIGLLELMFPGDLDEQKHALIDLMRRTARPSIWSAADIVRGQQAPTAMEWLETECIARLPCAFLPDDPLERERWHRLRKMRREWLFGNATIWTGALVDIESSAIQGNIHKSRGQARGKLLPLACEAVLAMWLNNLDVILAERQAEREEAPPAE